MSREDLLISNHAISHEKTMFDIFNMISTNCYQALAIQAIIENKKEEDIQFCDELTTAFEYYKWDSAGKQSSYTDKLVCDSDLEQWKKLALIRIISNNVKRFFKKKSIMIKLLINQAMIMLKSMVVAQTEQ